MHTIKMHTIKMHTIKMHTNLGNVVDPNVDDIVSALVVRVVHLLPSRRLLLKELLLLCGVATKATTAAATAFAANTAAAADALLGFLAVASAPSVLLGPLHCCLE